MARNVTLAQLRQRVLERTDNEGLTWVGTSEVNSLINASYGDLYDLLIEKSLNSYESTSNITGTGVTDYALPADFYGVLGVDYLNGTTYTPLRPYTFAERHEYENITGASQAWGFRLVGNNIRLSPAPSGGTYRLTYIPTPAVLSSDSDEVQGTAGWEEIIVISACIKLAIKDEISTTQLERELGRILERVDRAAENRGAGAPFTISRSSTTRNPLGSNSLPSRMLWNQLASK